MPDTEKLNFVFEGNCAVGLTFKIVRVSFENEHSEVNENPE